MKRRNFLKVLGITTAGISCNPIASIKCINDVLQENVKSLKFFQQTNFNPLDRINVRRLILYIHSVLEEFLSKFIWEPYDNITKQTISTGLESFFQSPNNKPFIQDYKISFLQEKITTSFVVKEKKQLIPVTIDYKVC